MKVGLVARADKTGLGIQTLEFYRHMHPERVLVMDLSHLEPEKFAPDRNLYPGATWLQPQFPKMEVIRHNRDAIQQFVQGLDVIFTCETPYLWSLFEEARRHRTASVLQFNFEFLDHLVWTQLPRPDLFLSPSTWHLGEVREQLGDVSYLPVPVNRDLLPFRPRTEARTLLHVAGNHTAEDRNGTRIVLDAMQYVRADVELVVRSLHAVHVPKDCRSRVRVEGPAGDYAGLYAEGDVFVMPRRFGGLCLPLNEAMSTGMVPLMTDCSPQNHFLDPRCLVAPESKDSLHAKTVLDVWNVAPKALAERIDWLVANPDDVAELSQCSDRLSAERSWSVMADDYTDMLQRVANER